jgi:uncharacterized protein (DUF305 family)
MADDERKAMLGKLLAKVETLASKDDVARIEATQQRHGERLSAIEARLDEQRQTINAMIPTHLAAVPPARQAS